MKSAKQQTFTIAAALSLLGSSVLDIVNAQENGPAEPWLGVGSASFYWVRERRSSSSPSSRWNDLACASSSIVG